MFLEALRWILNMDFYHESTRYKKRGLQGYYARIVRSTSFAIGTVFLTESIPALRLSMVLYPSPLSAMIRWFVPFNRHLNSSALSLYISNDMFFHLYSLTSLKIHIRNAHSAKLTYTQKYTYAQPGWSCKRVSGPMKQRLCRIPVVCRLDRVARCSFATCCKLGARLGNPLYTQHPL